VPAETLTYAALAAELKISPVAARRLPSDGACRAHFPSKVLAYAFIPQFGGAIVRQK
jgi:hypothetical protein